MKIDKKNILKSISSVVGDGVIDAEEIDVTSIKIIDKVWPLIDYQNQQIAELKANQEKEHKKWRKEVVKEHAYLEQAKQIAELKSELVNKKFMDWLSKEAPEICESLYGCMHDYEQALK